MAAAIKRWWWVFAIGLRFAPLGMTLGVITVTLGTVYRKQILTLGQGRGVIIPLFHQACATAGYLWTLFTRYENEEHPGQQ